MLNLLLSFLIPIPIPETEMGYTYSAYNWAPANAPLQLSACESSAEIMRGISRNSTIRYGTGFTVKGQRTATDIRMRFTLVGDNWQPLSTQEYDIAGTFTPGTLIMRTRRYGGNFTQHDVIHGAKAVLCSPVSVTFTDGSKWSWTPPTAPYPQAAAQPTPVIVPEPTPSPKPTLTPAPHATTTPAPKTSAPVDTD
jgi:hypothetical protein